MFPSSRFPYVHPRRQRTTLTDSILCTQSESPASQRTTVVLYSAAILALRPQVPVTTTSDADLASVLNHNLDRCLDAANEIHLRAELYLLGSRINKHAAGKIVSTPRSMYPF